MRLDQRDRVPDAPPLPALRALERYARQLGLPAAGLTLAAGQTSDVVFSVGHGTVWRFPRTEGGVAGLALSVQRATAARALGFAAPEVLAVQLTGGPGQAWAAFRLVPGVGLCAAVTGRLASPARAQLAADLAQLLVQLRSTHPAAWPGPTVGWVERWKCLTDDVLDEVVPYLPAFGAGRARDQLAAALVAAEAAPTGVLHGDLGGANLLLDPESGRLTGVVDWDDAGPGDPAVDLAAVQSTLSKDENQPGLLELVLAQAPWLAADLSRAQTYIKTFALQEALFGARSGDPAAWAAGTASYR